MSDIKGAAEFVVPFAQAVIKIKRAFDGGQGCFLSKDETKAVKEALQLLSSGVKAE